MKTGVQYLESIRDGREVWFNGERVLDVTTHPVLGRCASTLARLYDLQHDPRCRDILTFTDGAGRRRSMGYLIPRGPEDLRRLRAYYEWITLRTGGLMGRFSSLITLWHAYSMDPVWVYRQYNTAWLENMKKFWEWCVENEPWVSGAFHGPSGDRSRPVSEQEDPDLYLRMVEERPDGIVVSGYKAATLAPFANEIYVVPWAFLREHEREWALAFSIPASTPGVKIICREPLAFSENPREYPLSLLFDEIDAHVIFDRAFVPKERIFCAGEPKVLEEIHLKARVGGRLAPGTIPYIAWFTPVQFMVRIKLMLGVAYLMAQASGALKTQSPALIDALSEIIQIYQQIKALVLAAESDPVYTQTGLAVPRPSMAYAARHLVLDAYHRALCRFQEVVGGTPVIFPREKDFQSPELAPYLEKYLRGVDVDARRRFRLIRFARELGMNPACGRLQIFNHHADSPRDSFKKQTVVYFEDLGEAQECMESVEALLEEIDTG